MQMIRHKLRKEKVVTAEAGFPQVSGPHYLLYLQHLHDTLQPGAYFEIGTESGASLSMARCASVAVDPVFALEADVSRNKPQLHQFQMTSDAFFATGFLDRAGMVFDLAFLDGMHRFEFLLRDFMQIERHMARTGTITLHDCVPFSRRGAAREWDRTKPGGWTGDVWKLIPILREYRPDLEIRVLDLVPSGLVSVRGCDPESRVLQDRYDEIVERFDGMSLDDFGLERFAAEVALEPSGLVVPSKREARQAAAEPDASGWTGPAGGLSIAMKTSVREPTDNAHYGDYYFAKSIGQSLVAAGHRYRIDSYVEWAGDGGTADVDLVLHGTRVWEQRPNVPSVQWVLYTGSRKKRDLMAELRQASHVLVSSEIAAEGLRAALPGVPVSVLLQGFDADLMHPGTAPRTDDIVFVGSNHKGMRGGRPIIDLAIKAGVPVRMWGRGWEDHAAAAMVVSPFLPNAELGDLYRRAKIVLCDHMPSMRENGYVSNRIFDALACGAAVISDEVAGLPEEFAPYVRRCGSVEEFRTAVTEILAEGPDKAEERRQFALSIRDRHSLQKRAETIIGICRSVARTRHPVTA